MPTPSAAFSPLTTQTSTSSSDAQRRRGAPRAPACPGAPDDVGDEEDAQSARGALRDAERRRREDLDRDVVAAVGRVSLERLPLDRGDVDDGAELRRAGGDVRADGQRRIGPHVLDRDDERRRRRRPQVDLAPDLAPPRRSGRESRRRSRRRASRRRFRRRRRRRASRSGPPDELVPGEAAPLRARDPSPQPREQALVHLPTDGLQDERAVLAAVEADRRDAALRDRDWIRRLPTVASTCGIRAAPR